MIKIAVSRCLMGEAVRYDGTDKRQAAILAFFQEYPEFEAVVYCPEVESGLAVPRPPVRLVQLEDETIRALGISDTELDITDGLKQFAEKFSAGNEICGYITKKGSPGCGFKTTKLFSKNKLISEHASGIFISEVKRQNSKIPVIDEIGFADRELKKAFIEAVRKAAV